MTNPTGREGETDGGWDVADRIERVLFGDRLGLLLFLGALAFFGLYWRIDVFMTDSITVVNGLGALGDGHFGIYSPVMGESLETPGMKLVGGEAVARNYGQIILALPILLLLRGVSLFVNLHVALVAAWHLVVLGLVFLVGPRLERERLAVVAGSSLVLLSFLANLLLARQLPDFAIYTASLGILTLLAAGMSVVVCYRLLAAIHDRRHGLLAGGLLAVASPLAFWASLPKRHVFTGLAVLLLLYFVHRSRAEAAADELVWGMPRSALLRGLAYGTVGFYAWIHAGEALFMLVALAVVDVPTAPSHQLRTYAGIGAVFGLSLLPMVMTNLALSGNPVTPPRLLPNFEPGNVSSPETVGDSSFLPGGTDNESGGSGFILHQVGTRTIDLLSRGLETLVSDHERTYHTYVRSRSLADQTLGGAGGQLRYAAANLSYLESLPLAGGLGATIALVIARFRAGTRSVRSDLTVTDGLALVLAITFALLYADSLPLHAQYTQRYLFPLFPLGIYGLVRLAPTRRAIEDHGGMALWAGALTVLVGGQLLFALVLTLEYSVSEAFQLHGLIHLGLATILALALSIAALYPARSHPAALTIGATAGVTTVFALMSGIVYFDIGPFLLPVIEAVAELVAAA